MTSNSAEDRHAISDALAEYAYRWDRKDAAGFADLFTDDASMVWVLGGTPVDETVQGRADIEAYAARAHAERIGNRQSRHFFSNVIVRELGATTATTENMLLVTHQAPGEQPLVKTTGTYRIEWARVDERWLIAERTLYVDR